MFEQRKKKPLIVPIFIPSEGCPYRCVYCDQEKITGQAPQIGPDGIRKRLELAIRSPGYDRQREPEVAFYGGTFTNLSLGRMYALLGAVRPYLRSGLFKSVRVSTRPDAIDKEGLDLLMRLGVDTVELGAQSLDNEVLQLSRRGYTSREVIESIQLLKQRGFKVGVQLMPGLPGDTASKFLRGIEKVIAVRADMVRLYPTLVIRGTALATWYQSKKYKPWSLQDAVRICSESCIRLEQAGIPVIRIGLMSSPGLLNRGEIIAGPWQECFGFLVRSEIYHRKIEKYLPAPGAAQGITLRVCPREIPLARGYKNLGLKRIERKTGAKVVRVRAEKSFRPGMIEVEMK